MRKFYFFLTFFLIFHFQGYSQWQKKYPLLISIYNGASLLPGSGYLGIFSLPVHPGISAGTQITLKNGKKYKLCESFRLGGYYQKYSQKSVQLYTELLYQYRIRSFGIEPQIQAGYMMAFSDLQVFKLNGTQYEEKSFRGRSQFMAGAGLGVSYTLYTKSDRPLKFSISYQLNLQMPFIRNYVPLLPNTSLQLGTMFYLPVKLN